MESEPRRLEFSNPNEQLDLSALVNRFCEREPEEFNPDMHLEEARRIVKALEPKIEASSNQIIKRTGNIHSPSSSSTMVGATEFGAVKITVDNKDGGTKKVQKVIKGEEKEYRVGGYIVRKNIFNTEGLAILTFKNFWDHGRINDAFGNYPPFWLIVYDLKSLEIQSIAKSYAHTRLEKSKITIGWLFMEYKPKTLFVDYLPKVVWEAKQTN